jgi:hypothetical protein
MVGIPTDTLTVVSIEASILPLKDKVDVSVPVFCLVNFA